MKPVSITTVSHSPAENEVKGKAEKKSGKRIGYNYIILKSLKESRKNDVVTCLYIKSLTNFGICVIKEGSYGDSKDKHGRDIKDRLRWQKQLHQQLQDKVRLPRLLGSFEENGNYYLVLERIRGKSLYKACREHRKDLREGLIAGNKPGLKFLDYMIQMIRLLETLHRHQVIHRDVTATNFMITPAGKVAVIDMELSYSLEQQFPMPPFQLGTYGYMSPEQEATQAPAVEQDAYSAAAIILQMWTGISPSKLLPGSIEELNQKVSFFIPDRAFADIIVQCLDPDPLHRPFLLKVRKSISAYADDLKQNIKRPVSVIKKPSRGEVKEIIQQAIETLSSPLMADPENGWFSENTALPPNPDKKNINKGWYASFYKGASGVIYLLSKARAAGFETVHSNPWVEKGLAQVENRYINATREVNPGLHFGAAGIAAVLATAMREGLIESRLENYDWINQLLEKESTHFGFQYGIAGQGLAHFLCEDFVNQEKAGDRLSGYVNKLISAQQKDGSWHRGGIEKKVRATRGFANGVAGIVYFLLEYARLYDHRESLNAAQLGLRWLMKKAVHTRGSIQWRSSGNKEATPWWCMGAPGIALTFMKAWSISGAPDYKRFAVGALNSHNKQVIDNSFSQCHGLSGLGEIYLNAYRIFHNEEWLERSAWILQVLIHAGKQHNEYGPYWLVEHERQPTGDFMSGNSGIVHFLLGYCFPDTTGFPLLP